MLHADLAARRQEIEAVLVEDARLHPAFAVARRNAALAGYETSQHPELHGSATMGRFLRALHKYEDLRGGARAPSAASVGYAAQVFAAAEIAAYERARTVAAPLERRHAHRSDGAVVVARAVPSAPPEPTFNRPGFVRAPLSRDPKAPSPGVTTPEAAPASEIRAALDSLRLHPSKKSADVLSIDTPRTIAEIEGMRAASLLVAAMKRVDAAFNSDGPIDNNGPIDEQLTDLEKTICPEAVDRLTTQQHADLVILLEGLGTSLRSDKDADRLFDLANRLRATVIPEGWKARLVLLRSRLRERPSDTLSAPKADLGQAIVQLQELFGGASDPTGKALTILEGALVPGAFAKTIGPYQREELIRALAAISKRLTTATQRDRLAAVARHCDREIVSVNGARRLLEIQDWRPGLVAGASS